MDKVKLAICMGDLEFQERFVNCLMNHYKHQYEVHVFTEIDELNIEKPFEYSAIITGEYTLEVIEKFVERGDILLYLKDGDIEEINATNISYVDKYQEVYKIVDTIQKIIGDNTSQRIIHCREKKNRIIGIFSLACDEMQLPFAATLASLYSNDKAALLLDFQPYSGLGNLDKEKNLGMEDLLAVSMTGNYTKGRVIDCIRHETNWDYVHPVKNSECLMELNTEICQNMIHILVNELNYDTIILNFGTVFSGISELMTQCDVFYMPKRKGESGIWRERAFMDEVERRGEGEFLNRIIRIEIPAVLGTDEDWRKISEQWRWNSFGENLRQQIGREMSCGTFM